VAIGSQLDVGILGLDAVGAFNVMANSYSSDTPINGDMNGRANKATFDASRVARTSIETRPFNTAYFPRIHI
jgi:hypothetical protein